MVAGTIIAALPVISHSRLILNDANEIERLRTAGQQYGFFYLHLDGPEDDETLLRYYQVLDFMRAYFGRATEVKMRDARFSDTIGYEPIGTSAGAIPNSKDLYETLKLSRDQLRSMAADIPQSLRSEVDLFRSFSADLDKIIMNVLSSFSKALRRPSETSFERFHRPEEASRTTLSLFRYPEQSSLSEGVGHNKHTDLGTLTLLLTAQWGLQVLSPQTQQWVSIEPRPNMAVMNVGDSLRFLSGNALKSSVHRVMPLTELQHEHRYSLAYFLRPEDDVEYATVTGETLTAKAWHDRKFDVFRETHAVQAKAPILTGGMEQGDRLIVS